MDPVCLQPHTDGLVLRIRATPNAPRTQAAGLRRDRLHVKVKAPPSEGKANDEIRRWVAKTFRIGQAQVRLIRGERSREKDILLRGVDDKEAARILKGLIE